MIHPRAITIRVTQTLHPRDAADAARIRSFGESLQAAAREWSGDLLPTFFLIGLELYKDKIAYSAWDLDPIPADIEAIRAWAATTKGIGQVLVGVHFNDADVRAPERAKSPKEKTAAAPREKTPAEIAYEESKKPLKLAHVVPPLRPLIREEGLAECKRFMRVIDRYIPESGRDHRWLHTVVDDLPTGYPTIHATDIFLGGVLSKSLRHIADGNRIPRWMVTLSGWPRMLAEGRPNAFLLAASAEGLVKYRPKEGEFGSNDDGASDRYLLRASGGISDAAETDLEEIPF
ncbi:hypothetical protein C3Y89_24205 [Rhizobium sp. UPM1132]|uniref:hypothetical protein n=1 Tax=Rhizobium ruizarguesonis TaxID=2081791 RepID=UPI001445A95F|nr:hypothetical protein [Rhizobium ruizarguesonis]NKQ73411.1 hypothetical protein [Rhizobium ruizarguesonis]